MYNSREWTDSKPKCQKKLNVVHFVERIPCPYCKSGSPTFPSNLSLARHVLTEHNWNKETVAVLKECEISPEEKREGQEQETR